MKAVLITLAVVVLLIGGIIAVVVGSANTANSKEQTIIGQYENMEVRLSQYALSAAESIQIPDIATNDIKELIETSVQGTFGPDGARSAFLSITQAYPGQIDPSLYTNIQNLIQSGRANFADEQEALVDQKRSYQTALNSIPGGFFMRLMGYPRINLDDYVIISDERTQEVFKTGADKPINFGS